MCVCVCVCAKHTARCFVLGDVCLPEAVDEPNIAAFCSSVRTLCGRGDVAAAASISASSCNASAVTLFCCCQKHITQITFNRLNLNQSTKCINNDVIPSDTTAICVVVAVQHKQQMSIHCTTVTRGYT